MGAVIQRVDAYSLAIPLRRGVAHAASQRRVSEPVVVAIELRDGTTGYGETLPREYVTGESVDSVLRAIETVFVPFLVEFHPPTFAEALEAIEALPWTDESGRSVAAARACVELALLDAVLRFYQRDFDAVVQWMGLAGFGLPGSIEHIRFSGVLAAEDTARTMRQLRIMYWGGLRHFKLKVGTPGDQERVEQVAHYLRKPLERGRATLRVDANGAWTAEQAAPWLAATARLPIAAVEQPLPRGNEEELARVRAERAWNDPPVSPLVKGGGVLWVHDESLCTIDDARRLIDLGVADVFSIRVSKCGGLLPSLRLAALARRENIGIQLGCMVGETSILSAAGLRFLQVCPGVRWAEGCFGSFLLSQDVLARGLRFGFGGRPPRPAGAYGLGVPVDPVRLEQLRPEPPRTFHL